MKHSSSSANAATQPGWKKTAVLVAAGLVSFVLAIAMQGTWQAGDADLDLAATPRQRVAPTQVDAAPSRTDPAEASRREAAMNSPGQRMNKMVVRDPFGPLALEAALPAKVVAPPAPPPPPGKLRKPPAGSLPPASPTAPPLPFTAVGSIQGKRIGNGQQQAFIQHGDALTVIQKGDTVAGNYRVDDITPDHVVFTYLPLGQKQSLLLLDTPR